MENEDGFSRPITAGGWSGFGQAWAQQEFLDGRGGIDIHSALNVATIIFIVESTVDDVIVGDLVVEFAVEDAVQLLEVG